MAMFRDLWEPPLKGSPDIPPTLDQAVDAWFSPNRNAANDIARFNIAVLYVLNGAGVDNVKYELPNPPPELGMDYTMAQEGHSFRRAG
jgi:hypothetical protein